MDKEYKKEDFTPRPYQLELYEYAVKNNAIIYLPTGCGKTYIAVLLIKHMGADLEQLYSNGGKRTIFLVTTVALVVQQSAFIARHTPFSVKGYSGDMNVDAWSQQHWQQELENTQVLVMTSQILVDMLNHGFISLQQINLLIFDECHRGVENHPMRQVMLIVDSVKDTKLQPRILGMSATLLNSNVKLTKIEETLKMLECTYRAKITSTSGFSEVAKYSTKPLERLEFYDDTPTYDIDKFIKLMSMEAITILSKLNDRDDFKSDSAFQTDSKITKMKRILMDVSELITETGLYGASKSLLFHIVNIEGIKRNTQDKDLIIILEYMHTTLLAIRKLILDEMSSKSSELEKIRTYSSNKVLKLCEILKDFYKNYVGDAKFCCLIFVQRRGTAKVLYHVLKQLQKVDKDYEFMSPEFMVGANTDPYKNARENLCISKWNKNVVEKFRNGESNIVVATEVIDEGIDIQACTLIVRFYAPLDIRGYVQSKGRARHASSHYVLMANRSDIAYRDRYRQFQEVEKYMHEFFWKTADTRKVPTDAEIKKSNTCIIEPYVTINKKGLQCAVTDVSAISLLNRYCSILARSKLVHLYPYWKIHYLPGNVFQVSLKMPPASPLKETIFGDAMDNIDAAKRSSALKTCIRLHQLGELNDSLLPKTAESYVQDLDYLFPNWKEEVVKPTSLPGSTSNKREHEIIHPTGFYNAYPKPNETCYLHNITMTPTYSTPFDNRHRVMYNMMSNRSGFAILTSRPLPELPQFPIFMRFGVYSTDIETKSEKLALTERQLLSLREFHVLIFTEILNLIKKFMISDFRNEENSFLIVPIGENGNIDWRVVENNKVIERTPVSGMNYCDFDQTIVVPSYKLSPIYLVTKVREDIRVTSKFPNKKYASFADYADKHYGSTIKNLDQPMLEVKPLSEKINCIIPRSASKTEKKSLGPDDTGCEEFLIPELCVKLGFPALYWLKATCLPSIIHRISQLLIAEELRVRLFDEMGLGVRSLKQPETWSSIPISATNSKDDEPLIKEESPVKSNPETFTGKYSWLIKDEPIDLERNIENINADDINEYYRFIAESNEFDEVCLKNLNTTKPYMSKLNVAVPPILMLDCIDPKGPGPADIMQALTSKMSSDMFDLERSETLGDAFLKFAVSLYLFESFPHYGEGALTAVKGKMLGNRHLYYCGTDKNIPGKIKLLQFNARTTFLAPLFCISPDLQNIIINEKILPNALLYLSIPEEERLTGMISEETWAEIRKNLSDSNVPKRKITDISMNHFVNMQTVPDKSVSDSVEALIGTYLSKLGVDGGMKVLQWFEILPKNNIMKNVFFGETTNPILGAGDVTQFIPWAGMLEKRLGYKFKNRAFLLQAFTHPSFVSNSVTGTYQRLEFLGDAILDFLITAHIYESCGNLSPGKLTDLRSALVNNVTFACLAIRYGLHTCLLAYAPELSEIIDQLVQFQAQRDWIVDDQLIKTIVEEDDCKMAEHIEVSKVLGDIFESLIGAIYLDSGKNLSKVWAVVYSLMANEIETFSKNVPKQPTRIIHEMPQLQPHFSTGELVEGANKVMVTLEIFVGAKRHSFMGFGGNKKEAKGAASKLALKFLEQKI